jgi:hypothetical protein
VGGGGDLFLVPLAHPNCKHYSDFLPLGPGAPIDTGSTSLISSPLGATIDNKRGRAAQRSDPKRTTYCGADSVFCVLISHKRMSST